MTVTRANATEEFWRSADLQIGRAPRPASSTAVNLCCSTNRRLYL